MRNVLVILAHPDSGSFCSALGAALYEGLAHNPRVEVRQLKLNALQFDPVLHRGYKGEQPLEDDLLTAQGDLAWAQDMIWIYPTWWGNVPALLKGFVDRVFLPEFAFRYDGKGVPEKLLKGRNAWIITTSDGPAWYLRTVAGDLSVRILKRVVLEFCGVKVKRVLRLGSVRVSSPKKRMKWLKRVEKMGRTW